jgi:hypothetical protein
MSRRLGVALAFVLVAARARADFDSLVRVVGASRGLHRIWTPGISLARFGVWLIHPAGVHDFQIAMFDGNGDVDFERVLRTSSAVPIVRTRDNRTGETAVIWARPLRGDLVEMLLLAHDPKDQTVVLRAVVNGETLAKEIADPKHPPRIAGE